MALITSLKQRSLSIKHMMHARNTNHSNTSIRTLAKGTVKADFVASSARYWQVKEPAVMRLR